MKRIFISQPMRGKTDEEILAERKNAMEEAIKSFSGDEVEIIDSFFEEAPVGAHPLWFLGKSLLLLAKADIAYFCDGWQDARGCRIEHECAREYGISIFKD